ncbi:MAG: TIGR02300 family protein [Methyloceanibacter sp.]|uniref:TIGR02300 family protein n=1 Tax=Methyloceanibacter sp. TaxID=1965321 RepID=UPI003D9B5F3A
MSKPARGSKRVCPSCGARFYDLNRSPIICPVCQTVYQVTPPTRRERAAAAAEARKEEEDEIDIPVMKGVEVISLEEAEAPDVVDDEEIADLGEDAEGIPAAGDDDTFLEEEEEDGEADVTGIVGGPGKAEET